MKVKKTEKQIKEVDVVVDNYTLCDKCHQRIKQVHGDAFDFTFELKTGFATPSGGNGEAQEIDLCKNCALELVSNLKASGYMVNETEWDY